MKKKFTQIGVTALRGQDGSFLPAVPLYVESDRLEDLRTPGAPAAGLDDITEIFSAKFKQYIDGKRAAAV